MTKGDIMNFDVKRFFAACACLSLLGGDIKRDVIGEYGRVVATRRGAEVEVVIEGVNGWRLNVEYPPRLSMGDEKWGVDRLRWRGCSEGKADAAVWRVTSSAVAGEVKAVFCSSTACSAPIVGAFDVR